MRPIRTPSRCSGSPRHPGWAPAHPRIDHLGRSAAGRDEAPVPTPRAIFSTAWAAFEDIDDRQGITLHDRESGNAVNPLSQVGTLEYSQMADALGEILSAIMIGTINATKIWRTVQ